MQSCLILGGSGYIGTNLARYLLAKKIFERVHLGDIKPSSLAGTPNIVFHQIDVRKPIPDVIPANEKLEWIFNFAAIHREPGHQPHEYYETNILGAENVTVYATQKDCKNIFFTASISVYGPTLKPTDEEALTTPNTPYGISKLTAEYIHREWAQKLPERRLISVRPGVIYGPGDPGNILRMIRAVKKGYFLLPVTPEIKKSYGYIYGLLESMEFMMSQPDKLIIYNYVEANTESLREMITTINKTLGFNGKIIRFPFFLLKWAASILHTINPNINGIHPERVKKVARPTHIIPGVLIKRGFTFNYDLGKSLIHWKNESAKDFE
ncbi:MAG: NAD(P)-dependent oxidoreductase [Bacteroidota bacterium]